MFPNRPMRPMGPGNRRPSRPMRDPFLFGSPPRERRGNNQNSNLRNVMSAFQTEDGNIDLEKIMGTANQINGIYKQVSPMLSKFIKK
ncbi:MULTISPECIES: YppG family protein [Oceanobacillus]|uniref:YppG family protein n=1 Tax=Oceanobacillus TaxID=182709 RepID=UPI000620FDC7|nr:YppG family protein [Oceanobacillus caeni]KKE80386.1 hypothetical protein WH51_02195 [Bacilli bacterium VT-13-104]MBU8792416.1 YppG family protein [Oceanobacillus caeni]